MKKLVIAIIVLGLGVGIGAGIVLQQQEKPPILFAENNEILEGAENVMSVEQELICQCGITEEDLLTENDVLRIMSEYKELLRGEKGDKGDKGDIGSPGIDGAEGLKGDSGEPAEMPGGYWERFCLSTNSYAKGLYLVRYLDMESPVGMSKDEYCDFYGMYYLWIKDSTVPVRGWNR